MDVEVDQERHWEAFGQQARYGVGRMELVSWEKDMVKEKRKEYNLTSQIYKECRIVKKICTDGKVINTWRPTCNKDISSRSLYI